MPIKRCTTPAGEAGWKYGDSGHCYKERSDALRQMRAIRWQQSKGNIEDYYKSIREEHLEKDELYELGLIELLETL